MVASAGLLRLSWCSGWGGFCRDLFFSTFFFLRTHAAYFKYETTSCFIYISTYNGHVIAHVRCFNFVVAPLPHPLPGVEPCILII